MFAILLFLRFATAAAEPLVYLPSYLSFEGGLGDESYRNGSLSAGLTLPANWQFEAGIDKTVVQSADDSGEQSFLGGRLGVGSDPLAWLSSRVVAESWEVPSEVKAKGARVSVTWAPINWTVTVEASGQEMQLSGLPESVSSSGRAVVNESGLGLRIARIIAPAWSAFVAINGRTYDKDLSQLTDLPTVTLNRMPSSVMTALTGLSSNDIAVGGSYIAKRFDLGLELGRSISAVDGLRTRRAGVNAVYYYNRRWSFGVNSMVFRPESSQESSAPSRSTSAVVTLKW